MSHTPYFSVVVPLYNKRAYVRRAVDSVLGQAFLDFELIVVDDGSTDGSVEELEDIEDGRLRIILQANAGVGAARNAGVGVATGHWVAFLDADDAWLPEHLDELAHLAARFPKAGLLSATCIEAKGMRLPPAPKHSRKPSRREVDYFVEASRKIGVVNSTSAAVRRDIVADVGGFSDKRAGEDLEYWARVALRYPVVLSDRETCVYFRDTFGVMASMDQDFAGRAPRRRSLQDISPSIAMLCDRAEKDPGVLKNPSIRAYVNGRLRSAIRGALFRDQVEHAKSIKELFVRPLDFPTKITTGMLTLPNAMITKLLSAYRLSRRITR